MSTMIAQLNDTAARLTAASAPASAPALVHAPALAAQVKTMTEQRIDLSGAQGALRAEQGTMADAATVSKAQLVQGTAAAVTNKHRQPAQGAAAPEDT